jgi:hypothetical protein
VAQHYSDPRRASDLHALPDIETFEAPYARRCEGCAALDLDGDFTRCECEDFEEYSWESAAGWYWWTCFPGCLPDSDSCGPFDTEAEALADARESIEDDGEEA